MRSRTLTITCRNELSDAISFVAGGKEQLTDSHERLSIEERARGSQCVLRVAGELDILTSPELGALVGDRSRRYRTVVVELEDVDFIDSSGVNTILVADQDCRRDGCRLVATEGSRQVRRVLELCGLLGRPPFVQSTPFGSHALSTSKAGTRTRPRRRVVRTDGPRAGIVTIPQRGPAAQ